MARREPPVTVLTSAAEPGSDTMPWTRLPWDSEFFGISIGRIDLQDLTTTEILDAEADAMQHSTTCLYADLDPSDAGATYLAQQHGYRLVEVALDLVHPTGHVHNPPPTMSTVRRGTVADVENLSELIAALSPWSRYAVDPNFGIGPAERLHRAWVERAARGDGGRQLLIAEDDGEITAITTVQMGVGDPRIDLIATTKPRSGAAQALVDHAFELFGRGFSRGGPIAARNTVSMHFSENMGYRIAATRYLYHRWLNDDIEQFARGTRRR